MPRPYRVALYRGVCTALTLLSPTLVLGGEETLTPEAVVDLEQVTAIALAPDGKAVAYTLEVPRAEDDEPGRSYSELWLAPTDGGKPRRFTSGKERVSSPAFSPDGKTITFRVERKLEHDGVQIYAIPADGGEARPLTRHDGSVAGYRWSPDGKQIAYAATDAKTEDEKKAEKAGKDWEVEGEDLEHRHLWLLDVESGESKRVHETDLDAHEIHWTPDGDTLIFQATETARTDDEYLFSSIYSVPAAGGSPTILTETEGKLGGMAVSPGGEHLAYLGAVSLNDPLAQSLFVVPARGGAPARNLTDGYEGSTNDLAWRDDDTLLLLTVEGEKHALYDVDPASGERRGIAWPRLIVGDLAASNGTLAVAAHSPSHPSELFVATGGGEPKRLSDHNEGLADLRLARQEVVSWKGADDWTIRGVLTYPLDYQEGKRYPLVLQVHGGPEGVSLDGWTTRPGYPVQILAREGFMVLQPNYRGSQGRGVVYSKADHDDLGGKEFDDILAGVDALIERGMVDRDRVGTGGWSYGGYMSAWAATRWTDRFAASVVAAGLTNWISFAGTTDIPYEMSLVHWDSWWFDEPELHWKRSPIAYLNQARTPTLVVTGAKDERVHPEQAMQLYNGLRIKKVPTQMVFYPREPHGLRERAHQLDFIERTVGWFAQHLDVPRVEGVEERRD